ncbi:hypothetical protein [Clostridium perfringens]|uniref:hypothetical protein n=1 Tax=Clostridium perfringens TaxID=1502 RepID=UPI003A5CE72C
MDNIITYKAGDVVDIEKLTDTLVNLGYERVSKIEGFGQFSIRGGIIDIFSFPISLNHIAAKLVPHIKGIKRTITKIIVLKFLLLKSSLLSIIFYFSFKDYFISIGTINT